MISKKSYVIVAIILFVIPLSLFVKKVQTNHLSIDEIVPKEVYNVELNVDMTNAGNLSKLKTYLPSQSERQKIYNQQIHCDSSLFSVNINSSGNLLEYIVNEKEQYQKLISFDVECKSIRFNIPSDSPFELDFNHDMQKFLEPGKYIQSNHKDIILLGDSLKQTTFFKTVLSNFDYVSQIPNSYSNLLTNAHRTYKQQRASCNGKSRLLTAIFRSQGIPARVAGGLILEQTEKKTTHVWTEVYYRGNWIPFDALNDHFAFLPANYLELYKGDEFLFTYSKQLDLDYMFIIKKNYQNISKAQFGELHLWALVKDIHIPFNLLRTILLLPIATLLIAILRNVVGIKTFGVILPALIGLALINVNFYSGILAFATAILIVTLVHLLLSKWSLLYVPRTAIILTFVIISLLGLTLIGIKLELEIMETAIFLPIVIIAITAERFARTLVEDNASDAFKSLGYTFLTAILSCCVFSSKLLLGILLTYPELYFSTILILMILGRWIGMRMSEYRRFSPYLSN